MSKPVVLFLLVAAVALSLCLALLGLETLKENRLGWFLLVMGIAYPAGSAIYFVIHRQPFWEAIGAGETLLAEKNDRSFWAILPGFLAVFFLPPIEWYYLKSLLPHSAAYEIAGWILVGSGMGLLLWARRSLGGYYSGRISVGSQHKLIQSGPYRFIRHPSYAGMMLVGLGVSLGYASILGILAVPVLLLPGMVYRISVEESLLAERFVDEFNRYKRKTKKLIPAIW